MIKVNEGKITIEGERSTLLAEYTVITKALAEVMIEEGGSEEEAWRDLKTSFEFAKKSNEQIKDEIIEMLMELVGITRE